MTLLIIITEHLTGKEYKVNFPPLDKAWQADLREVRRLENEQVNIPAVEWEED